MSMSRVTWSTCKCKGSVCKPQGVFARTIERIHTLKNHMRYTVGCEYVQVGKFPDVFERLAAHHLEQRNDEVRNAGGLTAQQT